MRRHVYMLLHLTVLVLHLMQQASCVPRQKAQPAAHAHGHTDTQRAPHAASRPAVAPASSKCRACPFHSDVIATSRSAHYSPVHGPYDTFSMMDAFHATRLDWVYTVNSSFIAQVHDHVPVITVAMNPQCPDPGGPKGKGTAGAATIGRVLNIHGEQLTAPWMRAWDEGKGGTAYGCINNPDYLKIAFEFAENLIRAGGDAIQHDDPTANGEAASWNGGDPEKSGCYCDHCMTGFTQQLMSSLNESTRLRLNVSDDFNYRELLLRESWKSEDPAIKELRGLFVEYQQQSTEGYVTALRDHVDSVASSLGKTVTYSCNNGGSNWGTPYHLFDYGMGEMSTQDANPEQLEAIFESKVPSGKMQVMTMPKSSDVHLDYSSAYTELVRATIAHAYGLGGHVMCVCEPSVVRSNLVSSALALRVGSILSLSVVLATIVI